MITDCGGGQQWDLADTETIFVQHLLELLKILIAVAVWVYTWKALQPERSHLRSTMLGLENSSGQRGYEQIPNKVFIPACPVQNTADNR